MRRTGALLVTGCLVLCGCKEDPARSVKIAAHPSAVSSEMMISTPEPAADWYRQFCPPPEETSGGPSHFQATGPCGFQHRSAVTCEASPDDFIIGFVRKALNGATLAAYLNVENYHGPGSYEGTQIFLAVQSGQAIYRWSSDNAHAIVGPGEAYLTLGQTSLEAEPMLLACSELIGPKTNYQFQCGSRSSQIAIRSEAEVISGNLACGHLHKQ